MRQADNTARVEDFVRARIAKVTDTNIAELNSDSVLVDLGLQSIDAVILSGQVEDEFQTEVNPAMIFEHETIGSFAAAVAAGMDHK